MLLPILLQAKWKRIPLWKCFPLAIFLTIAGTLGTYLLFFIENHWIGGTSFFGAVFLVPLLFVIVAKLLRLQYGVAMDLCAPAECAMLVIMKIQCVISGCCEGRTLYLFGDMNAFVFPSQIAELLNALIIMIVLLWMSRSNRIQNVTYPWYMIIYGCSRFVLNIFRQEWITTDMFLPYGNIWSLVAITVGVLWLLVARKIAIVKNKTY